MVHCLWKNSMKVSAIIACLLYSQSMFTSLIKMKLSM